jgi:hypothetical protein
LFYLIFYVFLLVQQTEETTRPKDPQTERGDNGSTYVVNNQPSTVNTSGPKPRTTARNIPFLNTNNNTQASITRR